MSTSAPSESLSLPERLQQLRFALSQGNVRVVELFRSIDTDRSGEIEKGEFIKAMREWGLDATKAELSALFDTFDADRGGTITTDEFYKQLRKGADQDLSSIKVKDKLGRMQDVNLASGAVKVAEVQSLNLRHDQRRKKGSALHGSEKLKADESKSVTEQIRDMLTMNAVRVMDLFRDWDEDQTGTITFSEFKRAIVALGFDEQQHGEGSMRELFNEIDTDGSKTIEYGELNKALRRSAKIDEILMAGAAGHIEVASKNVSRQGAEWALQLALSVRDDADLDPLAALRRNSISRSVASPRGGAGPSAAEQPPSPSPALANSPRSFQRAANVFTTQLMSRVGPVVPKAGGEAALRRLRTSPRQVYARPLLQDSIGRRRSPPRVKSPPGRGVDPVMDAIKRHEAARQHNDEMVKAVQAGNGGYGNYWTEQRYEKKQAAKQAAVDAALRHHRLARDPELLSQLLCANSETGGDAIAGEEVDTPVPGRAPPDDLFDMTPVLRQSTTTEDEPTPPAPEPPHNVDPPSHDEQRPNNLPPISKATIRFYQEEEAMQRLANSPLRQHPLTGRPGTARPQKEGGAVPPRRPMTARCAGSFPLAAQESADRASPPKRGGGKQQRGPVRKADGTASLTQENLRITKLAREADEVMELLEQNRNLTNEKRRVIIAGQR